MKQYAWLNEVFLANAVSQVEKGWLDELNSFPDFGLSPESVFSQEKKATVAKNNDDRKSVFFITIKI